MQLKHSRHSFAQRSPIAHCFIIHLCLLRMQLAKHCKTPVCAAVMYIAVSFMYVSKATHGIVRHSCARPHCSLRSFLVPCISGSSKQLRALQGLYMRNPIVHRFLFLCYAPPRLQSTHMRGPIAHRFLTRCHAVPGHSHAQRTLLTAFSFGSCRSHCSPVSLSIRLFRYVSLDTSLPVPCRSSKQVCWGLALRRSAGRPHEW